MSASTTPVPAPARFQREMPGRLDAVASLTEALAAWAAPLGVPAAVLARVGLMLDELITNIVLHGYGAQPGPLEVEATLAERTLTLTLVDYAFAYDPLQTPETDTTLPIEAREIGGLGVQFVRRMADALQYERLERKGRGANALTLVKRF